MLGTIQFNDQFCPKAVKVNDIHANRILPLELYRIGFQKIIPQVALLFGHLSAQIL